MPRNDHVVREDISRPDFPLSSRGRGPPQAYPHDLFPANKLLKIIFTYRRNVPYEEAVQEYRQYCQDMPPSTARPPSPPSIAAPSCGNAGEGYIDTAVKVLIAVVLGALVLAGLYAVLNDTVLPTVTQRIQEMFDYAG